MIYEFNYIKSTLNLICSIAFGILGLMNFGLLISIKSLPNLFTLLLLLLAFVTTIAVSIMYLAMYLGHRTYVVINDSELLKDQGLIRPKKKVNLSKLKYARQVGTKIRFGLEEGKELRINLDCLNVEDIIKLENILNDNNIKL